MSVRRRTKRDSLFECRQPNVPFSFSSTSIIYVCCCAGLRHADGIEQCPSSKHGALSVPEGEILLHWEFNGGDGIPECFRLEWRERGGPTVKPAERKGFGRFVTDQMVTRALHATVEIDLAPEGIRWTLDMPASQVQRSKDEPLPGKS